MKNTKRSLYLAILLIGLVGGTINNTVNILADYTTYTLPFIDGTYEQAIPNDVFLFLGNELESIYAYAQPSIDIDTLSFNENDSQLELSFFGKPILDPYHEYRIMISWDEYIGQGCEGAWAYLNWDLPIYETTNVTLCAAGGASWFGVTNGSHNSFTNNLNESVLLEQTNDSVILDENVLAFPINSSLLTSYESPVQIIVYTLFTDPNETIRTIWFDAMPNNYLWRFFMLVTVPKSDGLTTNNSLIYSGLLIFVCAGQIIRRRRKK